MEETDLLRGANHAFYYLYLISTFLVCLGITWRSKTRHKVVLFFFGYYLISGSYSMLLTFAIPGISFMEIQPDRFLFLFFSVFLISIFRYRHNREALKKIWTFPVFEWFLYAYVVFVIIALSYHIGTSGVKEYIEKMMKFIAFPVLYLTLKIAADRELVKGIGLIILIGAVFSSLLSLVQLGIDPLFMRYGDMRPAFGDYLRSNGIFSSEYLNSYLLIAALSWTLLMVKPLKLRILLSGLFILGILTTFHRMSWIVLALMLTIYFLWVQPVKASWLTLVGLAGLTLIVITGTLFAREITNSTLVQERLSEGIDSRYGYYDMVLSNIGDKPLFGFGNRDNEVYAQAMMEITGQEERATGTAGSIHNGYLENLFFYGLPGGLLFTAFVVALCWYFWRLIRYQVLYAIPFFLSMIYMVGNLTNSFLFLKFLSLILAVQIGLFAGAAQNDLLPLSRPVPHPRPADQP